LPNVIPTAASRGIGLRKSSSKDAAAMPQATWRPKSKIPPKAMPAAGHTGETLPLVYGTASPIRPAKKYKPKTISDSVNCLQTLRVFSCCSKKSQPGQNADLGGQKIAAILTALLEIELSH
jgi:hypothetical protein